LGGHVDVVASDVAEIIRLGVEIGLSLNISKCELIAHSDLQLNDALLMSFSRVDIAATTLLRAPLFHGPVLDNTWDQRCDDLTREVDRLSSIALQDALILLRASFSAPKDLHMLRCSPSLEKFDALLKQAVQRITNSDLSDLQWIQASLPVRDGGLGARRVSSLALPAFLASAESTQSLQDDILTDCV